MDALLEPYLRAVHGDVEQACLSALLAAHAEPIILRSVASRLAGLWDDIEDVCSEARIELLLHLRRIKSEAAPRAIQDFPAYVAAVAANACNHYFRRRRPGRARLRKQVRFLLQQEAAFRLVQGPDGHTWCSLAATRPSGRISDAQTLQELPGLVDGDRDLATLLERILFAAEAALAFDDLLDVVARIWHIPPDPVHTTDAADLNTIAAPFRDAELTIDQRRYAARLWEEIRQLPRPQRVALLLSLRDGRGNSVLSLFPLAGIASFAQLAATLEVLEPKLASLWHGLPLDDNAIGELLGCSRQQAINLRMSARKRLANRMGKG